MWRMSWMPKAFTELVGTFFFLTVIALSGKAGAFGPLAIGIALTAMVYMGGHVSGAHYNPAVSFGAFLRGKMPASEMLVYWAAQLVGAIFAFSVGYLVTGRSGGIHPGAGVQVLQALGVEMVFTAALVVVILNVAFSKATHGNSFYLRRRVQPGGRLRRHVGCGLVRRRWLVRLVDLRRRTSSRFSDRCWDQLRAGLTGGGGRPYR